MGFGVAPIYPIVVHLVFGPFRHVLKVYRCRAPHQSTVEVFISKGLHALLGGIAHHEQMLAPQPRLFDLAHDLPEVVHFQQVLLVEPQQRDRHLVENLPAPVEELVEVDVR